MKKIVFTEEFCRPEQLFPFSLTRQVQDLRVGILTIREKWELGLGCPSFDRSEGDLKDAERAFNMVTDTGSDTIYLVHGNVLPTDKLLKQVKKLSHGECISVPGRESLVYCISQKEVIDAHRIRVKKAIDFEEELHEVCFPWDITRLNRWAIEQDLQLLRRLKKFQKPDSTNWLTKPSGIFIEKGAVVSHCFLNASEGPIYIAAGAVVMEGSMLRGPVSIGENAVVKMGTRIYGATSIGPGCLAGGEIKNSVFFGYSNKGHDGYLGDSVIGYWCNMGAGTSSSNLKNNASDIMVWTPAGPVNVGRKCGVIMGDYTRTAINTSINTGTVMGVCANVFGIGLTPKYIPSFSWGSDGVERYSLERALRDVANWKALKHHEVSDHEKNILKHIFDHH